MPTYAYRCDSGHEFDRYLPLDRYAEPQNCECGSPSTKVITAPMLHIPGEIRYESPIDGRPITSAAARAEDLARSGCVPWEPGIRQDGERRQKQAEDALERSIDETVEREFATMPPKKLEKLAAELQGGLTAEPTRMTPVQQSFKGVGQ